MTPEKLNVSLSYQGKSLLFYSYILNFGPLFETLNFIPLILALAKIVKYKRTLQHLDEPIYLFINILIVFFLNFCKPPSNNYLASLILVCRLFFHTCQNMFVKISWFLNFTPRIIFQIICMIRILQDI